MQIINGYTLEDDFTNSNAGTSSWAIASRNGERVFLKRFDSPKYSADAREACRKFEAVKKDFYARLQAADNGNIVYVKDFFREDTSYYVVTEYIPSSGDVVARVAAMLPAQRKQVMCVLANSLMHLEEQGIVHSDLKPANVILKETKDGYYTIKLIDFDSGYLQTSVPPATEIEGDQVYLAPEVLMGYIENKAEITTRADVFALGIMFHQFIAGTLPQIASGEYDYLCEAVLNGEAPVVDPSIPEKERNLIERMLLCDPKQRPSFQEIFETLSGYKRVSMEDIPGRKRTKDNDDLYETLGDLD